MHYEDGDIVSLDTFRITRTTQYCGHKRKCIDPIARAVTCADCNAPLDPMDSLVQILRNREQLHSERELVKGDIKRLTEKRDALRREVSNAKAAARRQGVKLV